MKMQAQCSGVNSDPFTQQDRCRSEADGDYDNSFQDRIEAVNLQMGDSLDGVSAGAKQKFRSLFVNGMINGKGGFAMTEWFNDTSNIVDRDRFSLSDEPGVIFAVDGDGDCVYEREDEFLHWAVEQEFDELILYNIDNLLKYGNRVIMNYPDPDSNYKPEPDDGPNEGMNDNIMGERETIEWHLSRFIYKAKTEYGFEVVAAVDKGTDSAGFAGSFYDFHINQTRSGYNYEKYMDLFGDYCTEFFQDYMDDFLYNPQYIEYKEYGEDTLFFPKDVDGRISTLDKMVVDVFNLYVFQMRTGFGMVVSGGGDPDATTSCNSLPQPSSCAMGFDAHLYEWEWWDTNDGEQADFELDALVMLVKVVKNLLDTDVCPTGNYICQDRTERGTWGASNYSAQDRVDSIDNVADRVYLYAYNSNPCDLYNSTQSSPGKVFHEKLELFADNSLGGDNNTTVIVPVFNAKYHSDTRCSEDRPVYYGDGNFGCAEVDPDSIPCDFCNDYSGNALNSLAPHYPKQMGFVENVFQDQYDLNPAKTSAQISDNTILGYCWFKSSLLQENDVISGIEVIEPQANTNTVVVYPNPSSTGEFIIQSKEESISQIDVFTTTGQMIYSQKVNALQENIHIDTKGIYLVRVTTRDNQTETLKIVNQ